MKITKLELNNFKRFDDLTIDMTGLAEAPKLVLLIGTNGSGKSSVFDAFEVVNKYKRENTQPTGARPTDVMESSSYYEKSAQRRFTITFATDSGHRFNNYSKSKADVENLPENAFYGRTSFRQVPKLTRTAPGKVDVSFEEDSDRPKTFNDRDTRFENDIEKVSSSILTDLYKVSGSREQILENYIKPINKSFDNIFGEVEGVGIKLLSIIPPLDGKIAEILFEKGNSKIPYDFLSSGEKEIFNIILNLLTRKGYFSDTIYFLDEIDLHLSTYLQKNLLKEITENWIPDNCQLWTASHSLGFIEYANETENAAIIDFDNLNFDVPQVIRPSHKNDFDVFEIAVSKEFLAKVFRGKRIIFSENKNTPVYNNLNIDNTVFFNARDKADVFHKSKNNPDYHGLIDRDYLSDDERLELLRQYKNLYILDYYSIENYYYHPDNLEEYCSSVGKEFNKEGYVTALQLSKKDIRDAILVGLMVARDSYPFYRENEHAERLKAVRPQFVGIMQMFDSEDFDTFYKVFPAKDYGRQIKERQNVNPADLAKTQWFKDKIVEVLVK